MDWFDSLVTSKFFFTLLNAKEDEIISDLFLGSGFVNPFINRPDYYALSQEK